MNPYDLSKYDPTELITAGRVGQYVKSMSVVNGMLTMTLNGSDQPIVLGKYKGPSGKEVVGVEITLDKKIKVKFSDDSEYVSTALTADKEREVTVSGKGLYLGSEEQSLKSTDIAPNGMYYLVPNYQFDLEVSTVGEIVTVEQMRLTAVPREGSFPVGKLIRRLPADSENNYIFPSGTPANNRVINIEFPVVHTLSGLILANNRYDFATRDFKVEISIDGVTWQTVLEANMAHSIVPQTFELVEDVPFKYLRFWQVTYTGDGGLGRLDLLTRDSSHTPPRAAKLQYLLPRSPAISAGAYNNVLLQNGMRLTSSGAWNSNYSCYPVLTRTTAEDWSAGTLVYARNGAYLQMEFPQLTVVTGVVVANGRAGYRTKDCKVSTSVDGVNWVDQVIGVIPNSSRSIFLPLPLYPKCKYVMLTSVNGHGEFPGIQRFDILTAAGAVKLNHKELVFDPTYFTTTETEDGYLIGRTAATSPAVSPTGGPIDYIGYSRLEWTTPLDGMVLNGGGASGAVTIPMGRLVVNNSGLIYKPPVLQLPKGRYKVSVDLVVSGISTGFLILQDAKTKAEIARGSLFHSNAPAAIDEHVVSVEMDLTCFKDLTSVSLRLMSVTAGKLPTKGKLALVVQLWKIEDAANKTVVGLISDIAPPTLSARRAEMYHVEGLTSGSNGKEFFDNTTSGATFNISSDSYSPGHYVTVVLKAPSKLWARNFSGYLANRGMLSIRRLDDGVDLTRLSIPIPANQPNGTWSQFTDVLSPGTYRFGFLGVARTDSQWLAEIVDPYVELVDAIDAPITSNTGGVINVAASTEYPDGNYPAWKAFQKKQSANNADGWLSAAVGVTAQDPAWLQVTFPTPVVIRAYQLWNGASPHGMTGSLLGSNDGSSWDVLHSFDLTAAPANFSWRELYNVSAPGSYSIYRLQLTRNSSATNVGVGELYLFKAKE